MPTFGQPCLFLFRSERAYVIRGLLWRRRCLFAWALVLTLSMTELGHPVLRSMWTGQFPAARVTSDLPDSQVPHALRHHPLGSLLREGCA